MILIDTPETNRGGGKGKREGISKGEEGKENGYLSRTSFCLKVALVLDR